MYIYVYNICVYQYWCTPITPRDRHALRLVPHSYTLQHTAVPCHTLSHVATHCNTLQHTALSHAATLCNALPHNATHCNALSLLMYLHHMQQPNNPRTLHITLQLNTQRAPHNTVQHTATHCNDTAAHEPLALFVLCYGWRSTLIRRYIQRLTHSMKIHACDVI